MDEQDDLLRREYILDEVSDYLWNTAFRVELRRRGRRIDQILVPVEPLDDYVDVVLADMRWL